MQESGDQQSIVNEKHTFQNDLNRREQVQDIQNHSSSQYTLLEDSLAKINFMKRQRANSIQQENPQILEQYKLLSISYKTAQDKIIELQEALRQEQQTNEDLRNQIDQYKKVIENYLNDSEIINFITEVQIQSKQNSVDFFTELVSIKQRIEEQQMSHYQNVLKLAEQEEMINLLKQEKQTLKHQNEDIVILNAKINKDFEEAFENLNQVNREKEQLTEERNQLISYIESLSHYQISEETESLANTKPINHHHGILSEQNIQLNKQQESICGQQANNRMDSSQKVVNNLQIKINVIKQAVKLFNAKDIFDKLEDLCTTSDIIENLQKNKENLNQVFISKVQTDNRIQQIEYNQYLQEIDKQLVQLFEKKFATEQELKQLHGDKEINKYDKKERLNTFLKQEIENYKQQLELKEISLSHLENAYNQLLQEYQKKNQLDNASSMFGVTQASNFMRKSSNSLINSSPFTTKKKNSRYNIYDCLEDSKLCNKFM